MGMGSCNPKVAMIIIVGASGGIGSVLFENMGLDGMDIGTHSGKVSHDRLIPLDITDYFACRDLAQGLEGKAITLINCSGVNRNGLITHGEWWNWYRVIEVNLLGSYNLLKAFLPIMKEVGWGRMIFMTSVASQFHYRGTSAYVASKMGLLGLVQVAAQEIRPEQDITINCLRLGYFDAGMIKDVPREIKPHHLCNPKGLVKVIETLVLNGDINGAEIPIDKGL